MNAIGLIAVSRVLREQHILFRCKLYDVLQANSSLHANIFNVNLHISGNQSKLAFY